MQYVVTGANRGIGLEFVRQLSTRGDEVIATARRPGKAEDLQKVAENVAASVEIHRLDITDQTSVNQFARDLDGEAIDVLINNAGVLHRGGGPKQGFDFDEIQTDFEVNAKGTLRVIESLVSNVVEDGGGKIVNVTSKMGSIEDNGSGGSYAYRMAKCALNMATRSLALDLSGDGVVAFVIHPGWVKTRMGGTNALISTEESVSNMIDRIDDAGREQSGKFLEWDGGYVPW